jgi:hypothetical protein
MKDDLGRRDTDVRRQHFARHAAREPPSTSVGRATEPRHAAPLVDAERTEELVDGGSRAA